MMQQMFKKNNLNEKFQKIYYLIFVNFKFFSVNDDEIVEKFLKSEKLEFTVFKIKFDIEDEIDFFIASFNNVVEFIFFIEKKSMMIIRISIYFSKNNLLTFVSSFQNIEKYEKSFEQKNFDVSRMSFSSNVN